MSLPRIAARNLSNQSKGVADMFTNFAALATPQNPNQNQQPKATNQPPAGAPSNLRRKGSQEEFMRADGNDFQQVSTMESPRGNQSFEIGRGGMAANDFREEYGIDQRGPFRAGNRPKSNTQRGINNGPGQQPQNFQPMLADIQLPPSMSQDKLMRFNANVDGKALLHDLDQKFESQDRMLNYLVSQINSMEQSMQNLTRKAQSISDAERDARQKLEGSLKFNQDQAFFSMSEVLSRVSSLEQALGREEKLRLEMREKLRVSDDHNRELANFIKSLQTQSDTELTQMRSFLQDKMNEDHLEGIKQKEKSTVLFNEVVRLGQEYEKQIQFLQNLNQNYESRIQTLESRLQNTEQSTMANEKRGDLSQNIINDLIEKLESKVLHLDQTVHMMRSDVGKERENMTRLEVNTLRASEDFKNLVGSLQSEFGSRLEIRISELVNRLLLEQEERQRSVEDIKYQLDVKEKMNFEKAKHEREEMRDRYSAMDAVVRSEFQRKDEAILALQTSLETQIRTINGWVKQEELARTQQEIMLRTEIAKITDGSKFDIEAFKAQQVQVTEKLSEMIRMEVDSRLSTDRETKSLIQNLIKNVMVEVAGIKDLSDKTVQKLIKDVKEAAHDSAERAHFLSRYIDEEVVKVGGKVGKQVENIKALCAKLTEQVKKHLINHENMKKDIYKRFEIIESHLPIYRSELYKLLEGTETRCLSKIKEVKDAIEQTMLTNFQVLDERVDQFSELVDSNMETLRKGIQDNREVFVAVINKTNEEVESRYNAFVDDLERVVNEVYAMQTKVDTADTSIREESAKLNKAVADLEAHINTSVITEKSVRKAQDQQLAEEIDSISKRMNIMNDNVTMKLNSVQSGNALPGTAAKVTNEALLNDVENNKRDIDKFGVDLAQLMIDYKTFKLSTHQNLVDLSSNLEMEIMLGKVLVNDLDGRLTKIIKDAQAQELANKEKMQKQLREGGGAGNPELADARKKQLDETLDGKIQSAFEKLRNDNLFIWKQSLELAQKEFTEKGVGQTMNMLPKTILDKTDLKRTVNSLITEENAMPQPQLAQSHSQAQLSNYSQPIIAKSDKTNANQSAASKKPAEEPAKPQAADNNKPQAPPIAGDASQKSNPNASQKAGEKKPSAPVEEEKKHLEEAKKPQDGAHEEAKKPEDQNKEKQPKPEENKKEGQPTPQKSPLPKEGEAGGKQEGKGPAK